MISIQNTSPNAAVKIRSMKIINTQTTAITGIYADFRIQKALSHSSGSVIVPQSFDSLDDIGEDITWRTGATISGSNATPLLRYIWSSDEWNISTAKVESQDHAIATAFPIYQTQIGQKPITIRNREALTITQNTNSTVGTFDIEVIFTKEYE